MAIKDDMEDVQEAVINELITENGITNTLADGQVTETKIANGAVTAAKLGSDVDLTIADGDITTAKINDDAVTTAKIDDDAVTPAKLDRAYLETTGGTVSGNVGIGGSPVSVGTGHPTLNLKGDTAGQPDRSGAVRFERQDGTQAMYIAHSDGDNRIAGIGSYPLTFRTNNTVRMQIQADGTLILSNVPTSSAGLPSGAIYSDGGTLKIVT